MNRRIFHSLIIGWLLVLAGSLAAHGVSEPTGDFEGNPELTTYGTVKSVLGIQNEQLLNGEQIRRQVLQVELADGQLVETVNPIIDNLNFHLEAKAGDQLIIRRAAGAYFVEGYRSDWVAWLLLAVFAVTVLLIGGLKGILTLCSLVAKYLLLVYLWIPLIKSGLPPLLVTSGFCVLAAAVTIGWVSGLNRKSLAAILGAIGGVIVAGLLGSWAVSAAEISGLLEPNNQALLAQLPKLNIPALIASGILIGALGATMDVAISIASAVQEIKLAAPESTMRQLYQAATNVGRDVMGTMVNTLILAYVGSAAASIILFSELSAFDLLNNELVMQEVILGLVGSIGLVLTIPLTAICSAQLLSTNPPQTKSS